MACIVYRVHIRYLCMLYGGWTYFDNKHDDGRGVKTAAHQGHDGGFVWSKQVMLNISEIGMLDIFLADVADTSSHLKILQRLKDIFHQNSFSQINKENGKLRTYRHLKSDIGFEEYFDLIPNESDRVMLTKF